MNSPIKYRNLHLWVASEKGPTCLVSRSESTPRPKKRRNCTKQSKCWRIKICKLLIVVDWSIFNRWIITVSELIAKLKSMQTTLSSVLNKNKKASTAVLFISFLFTFYAYPYLELTSNYAPDTLSTGPIRNFISNWSSWKMPFQTYHLKVFRLTEHSCQRTRPTMVTTTIIEQMPITSSFGMIIKIGSNQSKWSARNFRQDFRQSQKRAMMWFQ